MKQSSATTRSKSAAPAATPTTRGTIFLDPNDVESVDDSVVLLVAGVISDIRGGGEDEPPPATGDGGRGGGGGDDEFGGGVETGGESDSEGDSKEVAIVDGVSDQEDPLNKDVNVTKTTNKKITKMKYLTT